MPSKFWPKAPSNDETPSGQSKTPDEYLDFWIDPSGPTVWVATGISAVSDWLKIIQGGTTPARYEETGVSFTADSAKTINHSLGQEGLPVTVELTTNGGETVGGVSVDEGEVVGPQKVKHTDANNVEITFGADITSARVVVG